MRESKQPTTMTNDPENAMSESKPYRSITDEWLANLATNKQTPWGLHVEFQLLDDQIVVADMGGAILTQLQFFALVGLASQAYETLTDEDITALNVAREAEWQKQITELQSRSTQNAQASKAGIVYLLKSGDLHKIGKTKQMTARLLALQTASAHQVLVAHTIETNDRHQLEKELHLKFADKRRQGEWFDLTSEDIDYIKSL